MRIRLCESPLVPPCHSEPRSTRRRTICHPSLQALTHSRFKFRKRFRFAVGDPSVAPADANYPDPPSTTFWFRPMSAASLFFCNPASASRCRHPHPDGNVTLWHRIHEKKRRRRRNSAHSSCVCLCGRPLARSTWNESSTFHKFERALLLLHIAFAFAALLFSGVAGGRQEGKAE